MMMSKPSRSLEHLVDLREREVDRLTADMAAKTALCERYRNNVERLEKLYQSVGPSGALSPALSLNCAQYKQSVMQLADAHREDLTLHQADMAVAQQVLTAAARKHEALNQVLERSRTQERHERSVHEQKRQDEVATQAWLRSKL